MNEWANKLLYKGVVLSSKLWGRDTGGKGSKEEGNVKDGEHLSEPNQAHSFV